MTKRSPILAAVLAFILGPAGYLYIGWRYAVTALAVVVVFVLVITLTGFPLPSWIKLVTLGVLAWKGFSIAALRNKMIEESDPDVGALNTFTVAAMAMTDLLVAMGMGYAAAIGFFVSSRLILDGSIITGLLGLVVGTPILIWIASVVFGLIAVGIDAAFSGSHDNLFRQRRDASGDA